MLPDYFFIVAASSSGRYHPEYALGEGGLVRHTLCAVKIAHELLGLEMYGRYTQDEKDLMIVALILHDGWKFGKDEKTGKFTVAEHPIVCAEWIKNTEELSSILDAEQIDFLSGCVASHMGQWTTDYKSKKQILPKPKTSAQKFVHQADYLASRKFLIFDFGDNYYKPKTEQIEAEADESTDNLSSILSDIVELCKTKIEEGVNRDVIYELIKKHNDGNRNPNSIEDVKIAKKVKRELEGLKFA